jgi:trigger factor
MAQTATPNDTASTCVLEDAGPCRKRLKIEIPAERVSAKIAESFDLVSKQAQLPGFRPGKAPRKLIERRFGQSARDEARSQLASEAVQDAIKEHKLKVLGDPEGGDELADADMSGDKPITFTFEVEVAPEFDLPSFDDVEIKKPIIDVTEAMADEEIEKMGVNEGDLVTVEGKPSPGDYLVGNGVLTRDKDNEEIHNIEGAVVRIPLDSKETSSMVLGVMIENFTKALGKAGVGDEVIFKTTAPDQHEVEAIRSEPVSIAFTITAVHQIKPKTAEGLVAHYGMENEQQLREAIMLRLNQRVLIEQQSAMRQQLAKHLLDTVECELPEKLTANQAERNIHRRRLELVYQGVDPAEIDKQMDELRRSSEDAAANDLKLFFILGKAAMDRKVEVSEQEVAGRIAQMAAEQGQQPDQLRADLIRTNQIHSVAQQIREHKTLDSLIAEAKLVDTPLEEFNKWMTDQAKKKSK